jgi:hypothetical protein
VRSRLACFALVAALVSTVAAMSAGASGTQARPPGSPDLAAMSLAVTDFPTGARVVRQRYVRTADFLASYERELSLGGTRVGRSNLFFVFTELNVDRTLEGMKRRFAAIRQLVRTPRFRTAFARELAREADLSPRAVGVGRPRTPRIGDGAVALPIRVRQQAFTLSMVATVMHVDRVLASILVVSTPNRRLFSADIDRLSRVAAARVRAGLVPAASAPPLVTGVLSPGATLTATSGTWSGDQVAFTYQWERCAGGTTGCAPIPGAAAPTYTLTDGDLSSTLRVTVSGRNRLGAATSTSGTTAAVAGPAGSPGVTEAPLIEGVVGPGATLTATTGTWSGTPTAFAFQWRRCNATTRACADIAGATSSTYTLAAADSGSVLRVLVVATNASGPSGTLTAPTAPAP